MQQVYRFGPTPEHPANHLFVFLHASGADEVEAEAVLE